MSLKSCWRISRRSTPGSPGSSAAIEIEKLAPASVEFVLRGFRPAKVELGGLGGSSRWQISHQGGMGELTADQSGGLALELPATAKVTLTRIH